MLFRSASFILISQNKTHWNSKQDPKKFNNSRSPEPSYLKIKSTTQLQTYVDQRIHQLKFKTLNIF